MFLRTLICFSFSFFAAKAEIINLCLNYDGESVYAFEGNIGGQVVSTGQGGARYWNSIIDQGGAGRGFNGHALKNGDGLLKEMTLSIQAGYVGTTNVALENVTDDHALYKGWYGFRGDELLKIENIPARFRQAEYTILLYFSASDEGRKMEYRLNELSKEVKDGGGFSGKVAEGANVLSFHGLTSKTLEIRGNKDASGMRSVISGLQILTKNHLLFYTGAETGAPEGKAFVRWECGGEVVSVVVKGPNGGILHRSKQAMGSLIVDEAKADKCTLVVERRSGKVTVPVRKR